MLSEAKHQVGTSNNSFVGRIALSRGARNPHVPERTFRLLRSGLLALHPKNELLEVPRCQELSVAERVLVGLQIIRHRQDDNSHGASPCKSRDEMCAPLQNSDGHRRYAM